MRRHLCVCVLHRNCSLRPYLLDPPRLQAAVILDAGRLPQIDYGAKGYMVAREPFGKLLPNDRI